MQKLKEKTQINADTNSNREDIQNYREDAQINREDIQNYREDAQINREDTN